MEPLQIANAIKEKFPDDVLSVNEFSGQATVTLKKDHIADICLWLQQEPDMQFDYLRDLTGLDYMKKKPIRFEVVYHLYSIKHSHMIRLKAQVTEDDCSIQTVTNLWQTADWHERECYDMYGIRFINHPDLRRILLPEDWKGYPLRKDYPIKGPGMDEEWDGFKDLLEKSDELRKYEWNR